MKLMNYSDSYALNAVASHTHTHTPQHNLQIYSSDDHSFICLFIFITVRALCGTIDHRKIDKVFFSRRAMEVQMRQRESQHCGTKRLIHHQRTYFFVVLCAKHCTISPAQYGIQLFVGCLLFARRHSFNTKCLMCFDSMGSQFICEF